MLSDNDCDALVATVMVLVILFILALIFIEVEEAKPAAVPSSATSLASTNGVYLRDTNTLLYLTATVNASTQEPSLFLSNTPTVWQYTGTSLSTTIYDTTYYVADPIDVPPGSGNAPVLTMVGSYQLRISVLGGNGPSKYSSIAIQTDDGRFVTTTRGSTSLTLSSVSTPARFTAIPASQ